MLGRHHAILLVGSYDWAISRLPLTYQKEGVDVLHTRGARMGIDEVRALIKEAYQSPLRDAMRTFVIAHDDITIEAQNALLKLLEEPPATAQFYIIVDRATKLIPTLRSRLVLEDTEARGEDGGVFLEFQKLGYKARLDMIANRMTKKDDAWALALMHGCESFAVGASHPELLTVLTDIRPYFERPGASKKMILEHIALTLPPSTSVR